LTNLGRIAPDQKLSFATEGITLIYGDNGSGKSGYPTAKKAGWWPWPSRKDLPEHPAWAWSV